MNDQKKRIIENELCLITDNGFTIPNIQIEIKGSGLSMHLQYFVTFIYCNVLELPQIIVKIGNRENPIEIIGTPATFGTSYTTEGIEGFVQVTQPSNGCKPIINANQLKGIY